MSVATDPVCGMEVHITPDALTTLIMINELSNAAQPGRHQGQVEGDGERFYFCGRGCLLDFQDEPARFLDAGFQPSGM